METLQTPLNKAQLELLKLFSRVKSEEELNEIRTIIGQYYANKAIAEANRLWNERSYTQQTMDNWMNEST
jgi:hypothetical protein